MPKFGRSMLSSWAFDPDIIYLNHGTVGATPRPVLQVQQQLRDEMERQPSKFMLRDLLSQSGVKYSTKPRIRLAADKVAEFLGVRGDDLVFVDNATTGINAILRSFKFSPGDEILFMDVAYGAIVNAAQYVAREQNATVKFVTIPPDIHSPDQVISIIQKGITSKTRMAIIDHITSESALLLPIKEITQVCHKAGVTVLVDGAHAPGAIPLNIADIGADWYVGNLHKWAYAPRGCGILWAPPERQQGLHSAVISWGMDKYFTFEFDWIGTKDPTNALAAPAGIAFMRSLGTEAVMKYNHDLAWSASRMLCERFGTNITVPESMIGTMATLPLPAKAGLTEADSRVLRDRLLFEDNIEAQIHSWYGKIWVRISAQVYNEMADYEAFAEAVESKMR
jgi:isopenicillin-N epimerase